MIPPSIVNRVVLDEMQLLQLLQHDMDIDVVLFRVLSKEVKHTHAENVKDLDSNDYVV